MGKKLEEIIFGINPFSIGNSLVKMPWPEAAEFDEDYIISIAEREYRIFSDKQNALREASITPVIDPGWSKTIYDSSTSDIWQKLLTYYKNGNNNNSYIIKPRQMDNSSVLKTMIKPHNPYGNIQSWPQNGNSSNNSGYYGHQTTYSNMMYTTTPDLLFILPSLKFALKYSASVIFPAHTQVGKSIPSLAQYFQNGYGKSDHQAFTMIPVKIVISESSNKYLQQDVASTIVDYIGLTVDEFLNECDEDAMNDIFFIIDRLRDGIDWSEKEIDMDYPEQQHGANDRRTLIEDFLKGSMGTINTNISYK